MLCCLGHDRNCDYNIAQSTESTLQPLLLHTPPGHPLGHCHLSPRKHNVLLYLTRIGYVVFGLDDAPVGVEKGVGRGHLDPG